MAPRHQDEMIDRNGIRADAFAEDPFADSPFDPFDTEDGFDDSFSFDEVEFPEPTQSTTSSAAPSSSKSGSGSRSSKRRESTSRKRREKDGMGDSTSRMGESNSRMGDSSRMDSSRAMMEDGSSRRRPRTRDPTPKPSAAPSFPKNVSRRCSTSAATTRRLPSDAPRGAPASKRASAPPMSPRVSSSRPTVGSSGKRMSRRSLMNGSGRTESRRSLSNRDGSSRDGDDDVAITAAHSHAAAPKSPSQRRLSSRTLMSDKSPRASLSASDARSRIRKEAALKREKELREEQEAKLAKLKAKLADQKEKTKNLLGSKLAKLDSVAGAEKGAVLADAKSTASARDRRKQMDLNVSSHTSTAATRGTADQRRRRRTNLSHNILVRNMNQMAAPKGDSCGDNYFGEEDHTDGDYTYATEDLTIVSSPTPADHGVKKEAWQKRLERQQRGGA